ncbi:conserved hypothetical protein [Xenorhabdus nematophila F1]|nr:conserved hypothetical protein [Xenorhabdus nematophila F1]CEE94239.1 hypothetical protein XNA1_4530021 [Xenorhabdus nematophila str. Anatoliense]CEE95772.1 hypothetical protein XNA1_650021 [Xenorhabdus nematophila str. Anatoliense]CEF32647.1 hypothetical protein XNW1_4440004 [Xenorhabdus nematophila str. Websteri]CEF33786.1 hypothetical protein XNW1_510004 [Xenorhabdus nematophila str. Websteri]
MICFLYVVILYTIQNKILFNENYLQPSTKAVNVKSLHYLNKNATVNSCSK